MRPIWREKNHLVSLFLGLMVFGSAKPGFAQQAPQSKQNLLPLHLSVSPISPNRMTAWVALDEGLYKKNGLDVDQCAGPIVLEEMHALGIEPPKDLNVCPAAPATAPPPNSPLVQNFLATAARDPIVMGGGSATILAQILHPGAPKRVMILSNNNVTCWPLYARKGITSVWQLKGKRIGVLSLQDVHGFMALILGEAMGWDPRFDLNLVEGLWGVPGAKALEDGELDGLIADDTDQLVLARDGYKPLVDFMDWHVPMAGAAVNADVEWLKDNRETARRLVKALVEARAVMERDKGAYNRALVKYFGMTDPKMQDYFYSKLECQARDQAPAADGLKRSMQLYDGIFPQWRGHQLSEFIDDSFVDELRRSGYIDSLYK